MFDLPLLILYQKWDLRTKWGVTLRWNNVRETPEAVKGVPAHVNAVADNNLARRADHQRHDHDQDPAVRRGRTVRRGSTAIRDGSSGAPGRDAKVLT